MEKKEKEIQSHAHHVDKVVADGDQIIEGGEQYWASGHSGERSAETAPEAGGKQRLVASGGKQRLVGSDVVEFFRTVRRISRRSKQEDRIGCGTQIGALLVKSRGSRTEVRAFSLYMGDVPRDDIYDIDLSSSPNTNDNSMLCG
ncbi:hypothetical protein Tco_0587434 [Tanacetum coccineum]